MYTYTRMSARSLQLCLTLYHPMDCSPPGPSVHGESPGKNTEVGCHSLHQGIFLTQGLNPCLLCLLNWQAGSLPLVPPGKPIHTHLYKTIILLYIWNWHSIANQLYFKHTHTQVGLLPSATPISLMRTVLYSKEGHWVHILGGNKSG